MNEGTLPGGKRTVLNLVFLSGHVVFAVLGALVATWAVIQHLTGAVLEDREVAQVLYFMTLMARMFFFCVGGIVFLMWLHRAYSNTALLGATKSSPAFITFSIFIPFVQLATPYKGIQEIWRNSEARPDVAPQNSKLILAWWLFFLAWDGAFFIAIDEMPEDTLPSLGWWILALSGDGLGLIAAALGIWMVFTIRKRQKNQAQLQATRAYAVPPSPLTYPR